MKVKSFKTYLEKRLDKDEIADIEIAAQCESEILRKIQHGIQ